MSTRKYRWLATILSKRRDLGSETYLRLTREVEEEKQKLIDAGVEVPVLR